MDAKELRIGNYAKPIPVKNCNEFPDYSNYYNVVEVLTIMPQNGCDLKAWSGSNFPSDNHGYVFGRFQSIEPIPLTKEWLMNLGFEFDKYEDGMTLNYKGIFFSSLNPYNQVECTSYIENTIEYVHQLQNLYFALTGEELTLKQ